MTDAHVGRTRIRKTADRTFERRRDKRREMAQRELEKRWNDIEAKADHFGPVSGTEEEAA